MAGEIDFRALSPGIDFNGLINSAQAGNQVRMQRATAALEQQRLTRLDREEADKQAGNEAAAAFFENMGGPAPAAPMPGTGAAPGATVMPAANAPGAGVQAPTAAPQPADGAEIVVTAPAAPKPNPTAFLAQMARSGQGEMALKLYQQTQSMNKDQREAAVKAYTAMDSSFATLGTVPYEQRRSMIAAMAPSLIAQGIPQAVIDTYDPTDANIAASRGNALGIVGLLKQEDTDADNRRAETALDLTRRGQDISMRGQDITLRGQNISRDNARTIATGFGKAPSGYRYLPDGNLEAIPGGPAAVGTKQLTETQAKATGLYRAAAESARTMNDTKGYNPSLVANALDSNAVTATNLSQNDRRVLNAQRAFANSILRLESGAAITPAEINEKARTLFPAPGDGPDVVADKSRLRGQALAALRDAAGPGVRGLRPVTPGTKPQRAGGGVLTAPVNGVRDWKPR